MQYDELERLHELFQKGLITQEEYRAQKERILASVGSPARAIGLDDNVYSALIHLSLLVPLAGPFIAFYMWTVRKRTSPLVDQNGKAALNWVVTALAVCMGGWMLGFIGISRYVYALVGLASLVFVIIAARKASEGSPWSYPLSIRVFK